MTTDTASPQEEQKDVDQIIAKVRRDLAQDNHTQDPGRFPPAEQAEGVYDHSAHFRSLDKPRPSGSLG